MERFAGHDMVCRACLKIVENKTQSFGFIDDHNGNLKDMIMCCVPEMDIYVSSNPIMCFQCIQLLVTVYSFKTRCLNTETIIRSYIQRNNLTEYSHVNLGCVVQELIELNNCFVDAQHPKPMERNPLLANCVPFVVPLGFPAQQPMPMHQEVPSGNHEMKRNENATVGTENRFIARVEPQDKIQNLLILPDIGENPPNEILMEDGKYQRAEENRIVENCPNARENLTRTDPSSDKPHNSRYETDDNSEKGKTEDKHENSVSKECGDDSYKTVSTQEGNNNGSVSKNEVPKDSEVEKRPRLIIKICKNKITLPHHQLEDSNEKENKETDAETNRMEMPPPASNPLDTHHSQDRNEQELYECSSCTFITTHLDYYVAHKTTCFGTDLSEKKCPHCPHVTNRQNALNKHINTMHTRAVWYTCDYCLYRSTDPSCLRRHKRNMHSERMVGAELTCRLCKYRCTTNYHLTKHMRKHDVNSVLNCQFCAYSTRDRSNFRKHIFIHNPKPHNCEFCNYKCVSPYQMKLHLKKMHNGVGMEDVDCRSEVSISKVVQDIGDAIKEAEGSVEKEETE